MSLSKKPDLSSLRKKAQKDVFEEKTAIKAGKKTQSSSDFQSFIEKCRESDFNNKSICYIDTEVHEVLKLLKSRTGISIGNLMNCLAENFFDNNMEEIRTLSTKNKYLR